LVGVALAVLVLTFPVALRPVESVPGSDVTVYQTYGSKMLDGAMPYRDFRMEYPPGASVMFVLPATHAMAGGSTEGASWVPRTLRVGAITAGSRRSYSCSWRHW
jgi:hypothetical protein